MKLSAPDLAQLGLIDGVIKEPKGGAHHSHEEAGEALRESVLQELARLRQMDTQQLLDARYEKYRRYGEWNEA